MGPDGLFRAEDTTTTPKTITTQLREPELVPYGTLDTLTSADVVEAAKELQLREPDMAANLFEEEIKLELEKRREVIFVQEP